jgi:predicted hydrocarbon binding protein
MSESAAEVVVKGTVVKSLMKFLDGELSNEQMDKVLSELPAEFASKVRGAVLPTATFPVKLVNRLTEVGARAKGEEPEQFAYRAGRAAAGEAVKTVYKLLVIVLTPAALLQKATTMWRSIYSAGDFGVEGVGPGVGTVYLRNFPSELIGCARITGWITELGEMTKSRDLSITHVRCAAEGANECLWSVKWRA